MSLRNGWELIGSFPIFGATDLPVILQYKALQARIEGLTDPGAGLSGNLYQIIELDNGIKAVLQVQSVWLIPTIVRWSSTDDPYRLKFDPVRYLKYTTLQITLYGSNNVTAIQPLSVVTTDDFF